MDPWNIQQANFIHEAQKSSLYVNALDPRTSVQKVVNKDNDI